MTKTTVYLPDDVRSELEAKARRTGVSQAQLIRDAVRRSLDEDPAEWPSSFGSGAGGRFRAADDEAVLAAEWSPKTG